MSHRFIYECFLGVITDKREVDHINNNNSDNRLDNRQLITRSEIRKKKNRKKANAGEKSFSPIKIRAINIETGESFVYEGIGKASKDLIIHLGSISSILNEKDNTSL